jgi:signal transduction histidine kinase
MRKPFGRPSRVTIPALLASLPLLFAAAAHLDDARQAPVNHQHFDGYRMGPATETRYQPGEHIPGLNVGGWFDAGDYDIRTGSHAATVMNLVDAWVEALPVRANEPQLRRLLLILVDNALKYTASGGRVTIAAGAGPDGVTISVADTGVGIAPDDLPHVFERFWRADKVRSREAGGTGLGLAIARQIAQRHGADLRVESEVGRGSTFRIRFPSPTA